MGASWRSHIFLDMAKTEHDKKEFIPALGYHWLTDFYDFTIRLTMPEKRFRMKLVQLLNPQANERILEFGYGTGQNLVLAYQQNTASQFVGLDIDPKVKTIAVGKLKSMNAPVDLDLYEGAMFPYRDNEFDKVFSSLVFHQLDGITKQNALNEIFRVMKPGGKLLIGDWGKAKNTKMRWAFYIVQLLDGFATTNDNVNGLMPEFIMNAGFSDVDEPAFVNTQIGTYSYYTATKIKTDR